LHTINREKIEALFNKDRVLIAILDSGLGGFSICAELERALQERPLFRNVSLFFFNVWPEQARGYNSLGSVSERVRVFDRALTGVQSYNPDLIMIACNTLSVIYERTPCSQHETIPIVDIVDFGVDLIFGGLTKNSDSQVLILGTRTTISENVHQRILVQRGIAADRIITQACHGVATEIEKAPQGEAVVGLIARYMRQAAPKIDGRGTVFVALCCTHFAYSANIFRDKLREELTAEIELLDPNTPMSDFLFNLKKPALSWGEDIKVKVISKILLEQTKIQSIAGIISSKSEKASDALVDYTYQPDLFEV
jgi:glutamate racemase